MRDQGQWLGTLFSWLSRKEEVESENWDRVVGGRAERRGCTGEGGLNEEQKKVSAQGRKLHPVLC